MNTEITGFADNNSKLIASTDASGTPSINFDIAEALSL
jgi:hypothetical protein